MFINNKTSNWKNRLKDTLFGRYFLNESFFHYFWTGGLFTLLNIFLVWLFIDILKISTIISSIIVIGGLFIMRYIVFKLLKVM